MLLQTTVGRIGQILVAFLLLHLSDCTIPVNWQGQWWRGVKRQYPCFNTHVQVLNKTSWKNIQYGGSTGQELVDCTYCKDGNYADRTCTKYAVVDGIAYCYEQSATYGNCAMMYVNKEASIMVYGQITPSDSRAIDRAEQCAEGKRKEKLHGYRAGWISYQHILVKYPFDFVSPTCPFANGEYFATVKHSHARRLNCVWNRNSQATVHRNTIQLRLCEKDNNYSFPFHSTLHCMGEVTPESIGSTEEDGKVALFAFNQTEFCPNKIQLFYVVRYRIDADGTVRLSIQGRYRSKSVNEIEPDPTKRFDSSGYQNTPFNTVAAFQHALTLYPRWEVATDLPHPNQVPEHATAAVPKHDTAFENAEMVGGLSSDHTVLLLSLLAVIVAIAAVAGAFCCANRIHPFRKKPPERKSIIPEVLITPSSPAPTPPPMAARQHTPPVP